MGIPLLLRVGHLPGIKKGFPISKGNGIGDPS